MFSSRSHGDQEFLIIKPDDKFFSRLLSKEKPKGGGGGGDSSLRFYYRAGCSGSIPFQWESQPGTPKHALADSCIFNPPLTPPPSLHSSAALKSGQKQPSKIKLFLSNFPGKLSRSFSSPAGDFSGRRHGARSDFLFQLEKLYGDDSHRETAAAAGDFPPSPLCFGGRSRRSKGGFGRFYYVKNMKRALLSVVARGGSST
ncbi:uncharacterized protein LOC115999585 [Ipomoea triloba]|uniref:uncharacterized protein LOC115999585 n=1 Tax=Ipomoea triloba TaxID=35885 RepID=UPI00125D1801|nr:uncharacterized protein LOC115999585 [Ipomoea triloba]